MREKVNCFIQKVILEYLHEIKITQTLNAVRDQSRENFCKVGFFFLPFKKDLSFYFPWIPRTDQ